MVNIKRRGLILILSAPSGTGKTTIANKIIKNDNHIDLSVSCTTRSKREGEINGTNYYFYSKEKFISQINNNKFLEYATIFNDFYGTPKQKVLEKLENGIDVLFDIDWQGHRQLLSTSRADVTSIFLLPPSKKELLRRLNFRNLDNQEEIKKRIGVVDEEISHWYEYDYVIINKDIYQSIEKIMSILRSERLKKERRIGINNFVSKLIHESFIYPTTT